MDIIKIKDINNISKDIQNSILWSKIKDLAIKKLDFPNGIAGYINWRINLITALEAKYPKTTDHQSKITFTSPIFLFDKSYYIKMGFEENELTQCKLKALDVYHKALESFNEKSAGIFADIITTLADNFRDALFLTEKYKSSASNNDPITLLESIFSLVMRGAGQNNSITYRCNVRSAFENVLMKNSDSLDRFLNHFTMLADVYDTVNIAQGGSKLSEDQKSERFLLAIANHPSYAQYAVEKLNEANNAEADNKVLKRSVRYYYDNAPKHVVSISTSNNSTSTAFFTTNVSHAQQRKVNENKFNVSRAERKMIEKLRLEQADKNKPVKDKADKVDKADKDKADKDKAEKDKAAKAANKSGSGKPSKKQLTDESIESAVKEASFFIKEAYNVNGNSVNKTIDNYALLDNQSNISIFHPLFLSNIRLTNNPIYLQGIHGKEMKIDKVGDLDRFFTVYCSDSVNANILSFTQVEKKYDITYYPGNKFSVEMGKDTLDFLLQDGLFKADMSDWCAWTEVSRTCNLAVSASERDSGLTGDQITRARRAYEFARHAGYLSYNSARKLITSGVIKDLDLTVKDLDNAYHLYGPDPDRLKGTHKNRKPHHADINPLPSTISNSNQVMIADIFYCCAQTFLLSVMKPLGLVIVNRLKNRRIDTLSEALDKHLNTIHGFGYKVTKIITDDESGFKSLQSKALIPMECSGAGDHLPVADERIKSLKDIIRPTFLALEWELPGRLVVFIVSYSCGRLNMLFSIYDTPPKLQVSTTIPSYKREFAMGFGTYCEVHESNVVSNDVTQSRTVSAIALQPSGNSNGSWLFFNIATGHIINRSNYTICKTNKLVIDKMNAWAKKDNESPITIEWLDAQTATNLGKVRTPDGPNKSTINSGVLGDDSGVLGAVSGVPPLVNDRSMFPTPAVKSPTTTFPGAIQLAVSEVPNVSSVQNDLAVSVPKDINVPNIEIQNAVVQPENTIIAAQNSGDVQNSDAVQISGAVQNSGVEETAVQDPVTQIIVQNADVTNKNVTPKTRFQPLRHKSKYETKFISKTTLAIARSFNISVKRGLLMYREVATEAIKKELKQMSTREVFGYDPFVKGKNMVRSHMFLKEKLDENGKLATLKARLVAMGNMQTYRVFDDNSSPTVKSSSTIMVLKIAVCERRHIIVADIGGAYLHAPMDEELYLHLDPDTARILVSVDSNAEKCLRKDGSAIVRLKRALYGCKQSGKLWYLRLSTFLKKIGFIANPEDGCVFNTNRDGSQLTVLFHVDDLLMTSVDEKNIAWIRAELIKEFGDVKEQTGDKLSYLGMLLEKNEDGNIHISTPNLMEDILKDITHKCVNPATSKLLSIPDGPLLSEKSKEAFHSMVAKLLYVARMVRPDIMLAVSFLTTRVTCPTEHDQIKLLRILGYLNGTRELKFIICSTPYSRLVATIDASFGKNENLRSQTGFAIFMGNTAVQFGSCKQKLITANSTEAELCALSDKYTILVQLNNFLKGQGVKLEIPIAAQDNKSAIAITAVNAKTLSNNYMRIRQGIIIQCLNNNDFKIVYLPTELMVADVLTKPLQGKLFLKNRGKMLGSYYADLGGARV